MSDPTRRSLVLPLSDKPSWAFDPTHAVEVAGYGFWLSVVGLILTIIGFAITLYQLSQTRSSADSAKREVERIQKSLNHYEIANEAAKATAALSTARNYVRTGSWVFVVDSYETVRDAFNALKDEVAGLTDDQKESIAGASVYIQNLCSRIERDSIKGTDTVDPAKTLAVMAVHRTLLQEITRAIEKGVIQ